MQSFVARLRGRAISQSTTISAQSEEPFPNTPDTPTFHHAPQLSLDASAQQLGIDRKILPQVHELLDSYSVAEESISTGLTPRPVKQRSPIEHNPRIEVTSDSEEEPDARAETPSQRSQRSLRFSGASFSRLSQRIASTGPWSTFGRHKDSTTPRLSSLEYPPSRRRFHIGSVDTFAIPRRSRSSRSVTALTVDSFAPSDHTRQASRASESSSWLQPQSIVSSHRRSLSLSAINPEEPTTQERGGSSPPTTSSRKPSTKHSIITQSSSAQSHALTVNTSALQASDVNIRSGSPHTFGHNSPPLRLSAFISSPPQIPPIPVLDPGIYPTPSPHSEPIIRDLSNIAPGPGHPLRHWASSLHAKTFPPRGRRKTVGSKPDENSVPFPSVPRQRLRTYSSFPAVRHLFDHPSRNLDADHLQAEPNSTRRSSADWNARQATSGVLSDSAGDYGWPAEVTKELIRLSLSDKAAGKLRERGTEGPANPDISRRGNSVPPSSELEGRPCSPLFSPNFPPHNKEGTSEGGDKPTRSHPQLKRERIKSGGVVEGKSSMSVRNGVPLSTLKEDGDDVRQPETLPKAATGTRGHRKSILRQSSSVDTRGPDAGPSAFPTASRRSSLRRPSRHSSEPTLTQVAETPTKSGKRKAEDVDLTPPDARNAQHTTFAIPPDHRRTHLQSEPSRAPSAYPAYQRKRVRLSSSSSPAGTPNHSRPSSSHQHVTNVFGTPSNRLSNPPPSPALRALSRAASTRSIQPSVASLTAPSAVGSRRDRRRSQSERSIPVGAIVSPQPPSLSRSSTYHMRDPRRPPRVHSTPWTLRKKTEDEDGSSIHAWIFFIGFLLFPLWWVASFLPIPHTRHVGGTDTEKAVALDDPQVEHDARSWRSRCRIMACVSFLTYIPFIVLVAIFASR